MIPIFNVCKSTTCGLIITGLTKDAGNYLPEDSTENISNTFKYSETVTINVIQLDKIDELEFIKSTIVTHLTDTDEAQIDLLKDGNYQVSHILIPTIAWLQKEIANPTNSLSSYSTIYVSDGITIFKYIQNELIECPALELVERNPEGTTISIAEKNSFSICYLSKCFVTLCNEILNMNLLKCKSKNADLDDLIFRRDFIWMTINVIKYSISLGQYSEAQRILEQITACNGFCNSSDTKYKTFNKSSGCGCN